METEHFTGKVSQAAQTNQDMLVCECPVPWKGTLCECSMPGTGTLCVSCAWDRRKPVCASEPRKGKTCVPSFEVSDAGIGALAQEEVRDLLVSNSEI